MYTNKQHTHYHYGNAMHCGDFVNITKLPLHIEWRHFGYDQHVSERVNIILSIQMIARQLWGYGFMLVWYSKQLCLQLPRPSANRWLPMRTAMLTTVRTQHATIVRPHFHFPRSVFSLCSVHGDFEHSETFANSSIMHCADWMSTSVWNILWSILMETEIRVGAKSYSSSPRRLMG